jgi:hydrogenase maturation protease
MKPAAASSHAGALVVGWGSELHGDDGVGRRVAERLAASAPDGVEALSLHQLTPEVAARLAGAERVYFVDADVRAKRVTADPLPARPATAAGPGLGHALDPAGLVDLAERLVGRRPEAWLVRVPARDMELRIGLSPAAEADADRACRLIRSLLDGSKKGPGSISTMNRLSLQGNGEQS